MANIMQRAYTKYYKLRWDFDKLHGYISINEQCEIAERSLKAMRQILNNMIDLSKITCHLDSEQFGKAMKQYDTALRTYHDLGIVSEKTYKEAVQRFEMEDLEPWE